MSTVVLYIHSYLRWVVLLLLVALFVRSLTGWLTQSRWRAGDTILGNLTARLFGVQVAVGIIQYVFFSPIVRVGFSDFGAAMGDSQVRFFLVEHGLAMLVAVALLEIGWARAHRRATTQAFGSLFLFVTLALLLVVVSIPWPGTRAGRPFFRTDQTVAVPASTAARSG